MSYIIETEDGEFYGPFKTEEAAYTYKELADTDGKMLVHMVRNVE